MRSATEHDYRRPVVAAFFNVGDIVTFGKYQNKKAKIVAFHDDGKGNPLVELEPIPKGRKKNKTIALFKIRHEKKVAMTASRVAERALTSQRVAVRYMAAAKDMETILLQLRKGVWGSISSVGKLKDVLDHLGGWNVEPFVGLVHVRFAKLFVGSEADAQEAYALALKHRVTSLPATPKVDEFYLQDLGEIKDAYGGGSSNTDNEKEFRFSLWVGAWGFKVVAPNGKVLEILPDDDAWARGRAVIDLRNLPKFGKRSSKFIRLYDVPKWLEKETGFKQQVLDALGMGAHEKAKPRTKENTGSCPCCFRNIKLKYTSGTNLPKIVNHGFKRPGWGRIVGNCIGVGFPPFELSSEGTQYLVEKVLQPQLKSLKGLLVRLNNGTIEGLSDFRGQLVKPGDPSWPRVLEARREQVPHEIGMLERDITFLEKLIRAWKEEPLPKEGTLVREWQLEDQ